MFGRTQSPRRRLGAREPSVSMRTPVATLLAAARLDAAPTTSNLNQRTPPHAKTLIIAQNRSRTHAIHPIRRDARGGRVRAP